jgi:phosphatidylserine/phosphatidylglycerophosphate/cardiolipin synthase-like enzyme
MWYVGCIPDGMGIRFASSFAPLALVAACSSGPGAGDDAQGEAATEATFSYAGQAVIAKLHAKHDAMRGRTWDFATDGRLDPGWVVQSPLAEYWGTNVADLPIAQSCDGDAACDPDFGLLACASQDDCTHGGTCKQVASTVTAPGMEARSLCVGHSDAIYDDIYEVIRDATAFVDITSLSPPDGRFEAAVRNAVTYLSNKADANVRVRLLYGDIILGTLVGDGRGTGDVLKSVVRDVAPGANVRVVVGEYRDGLTSWDHAKIVSADGATAIVGGHNMWTKHYLEKNPVHDISMKVHGSAAAHASHFANELWAFTCHRTGFVGYANVSDYPAGGKGCDEAFALAPAAGTGHAKIVSVGRLGAVGDEAADDAIVALVDSAKTTLRLSLQDIGPPGAAGVTIAPWPEQYLRALVAAVGRGVDVELILSNKGAVPGGLLGTSASYSNGYTPGDVVKKLAAYGKAHPELLPAGAEVTALLCQKLHAAALRPGPDDAWPDGASFANHAKLAIVDDRAFYMGSQNWYPANLAEFGYVVDDVSATAELLAAYYTPAWTASSRTAESGAGASSCVLGN